jgi:hypothetical protein
MLRPSLASIFAYAALVPSIADARPLTAGVGLGRFQAENDWDGEADDTLQLFGRLGLTSRISGQLEIQKIEGSTEAITRSLTAHLVVELGQSGRLVPTMFAGLGVDRGTTSYASQSGHHIEGGFGLEYRLDGGLSLMADVRLGGRSIDQSDEHVYLDEKMPTYVDLYAPTLIEGEYRSARVGVGLRF